MTTERKDETTSQDTVPEDGQAVPAGGPRIVVNPKVFSDNRDATCVAWNEAFRIVMEENEFNPQSEPTDDQRRFFSDTAYADDEAMLRRTILARICTFDTSVKDPTDERSQKVAEAFVRSVSREIEEDIPIWAAKRYVARPQLAPGEAPILEYRRWFNQFYAEAPSGG